MVSDEHWDKIQLGIRELAKIDGVDGSDPGNVDYFRTHDDLLYDEDALDEFLKPSEAATLVDLKEKRALLDQQIAEREPPKPVGR